MKTPIQRIIKALENISNNELNEDKSLAYEYCIYLAKTYLQDEKDTIIDAFRYGNSNEILGKKHSEEYYNDTFTK